MGSRMIHVWMIILFLILFMLVHIAKMTRLYLVLLEQKISFGRFVVVYLKTTCVNLIVPFKLGEIYRVYALAKETKKFPVGFLSVLVDRFFDTVSLLLILIPVFLLQSMVCPARKFLVSCRISGVLCGLVPKMALINLTGTVLPSTSVTAPYGDRW